MIIGKNIQKDLFRYKGESSYLAFLKLFFSTPSFRFLVFFRLASKKKRFSLGWFIYNVFLKLISHKFGFQIPSTTNIGDGFYIGHFGVVVINDKSIIGKNCNIAHNVTIGQISTGIKAGCPCIGNSVWIGAGAVIVGKIFIGDDVLIAPNSFVNFDVPSNSLVIGNPGKIIHKINPTEGYILNHI
ncbi:serine O-acetyltransferase [Aquirufa lenticrescens]